MFFCLSFHLFVFCCLSVCLSVQNELCVAPGPGKDMVESTQIIATKQYDAAKVTNYSWPVNIIIACTMCNLAKMSLFAYECAVYCFL